MKLSREINNPRSYVGYSFFVLLALSRKTQLLMWEGEFSVNLLETFAPWALDTAVAASSAQGVATCLVSLPDGQVQMFPVSETHPLHLCRHWIGCRTMDVSLKLSDTESIFAFYADMGIMLFETVCDGDCGPDAACMMLGLPRSSQNRSELRTEVATYLLQRRETPWMLDMLVALQELDAEVVDAFRSGEVSSALVEIDPVVTEAPIAPETPAVASQLSVVERSSAVADQPVAAETSSAVADADEILKAIQWATGLKDLGILYGLVNGLPDWTIDEHVVAYRNRGIMVAKKQYANTTSRITVAPNMVSSRMKVAAEYHAWLRSGGHLGKKAPRNVLNRFVDERLVWQHRVRDPRRNVARWYTAQSV